MDPLIQGRSGTAPEASRNAYGTHQGTNEDDSQSDLHPEASTSQSQTPRNSGPDDAYTKEELISGDLLSVQQTTLPSLIPWDFTSNKRTIEKLKKETGEVVREVFWELLWGINQKKRILLSSFVKNQ